MDRRTFPFASSGAALGSLVASGWAIAEEGEASPWAASGLVTGTPKALRYKEVSGFLSAGQIAPHHNAHYGGALKAFTGVAAAFESSHTSGTAIDPGAFDRLKRLQASRGNSVLLHELYFDGMALGPTTPLVVIDTYEHAFYVDYQGRKSEYVEKFLGFTDWAEAERRYRPAVPS